MLRGYSGFLDLLQPYDCKIKDDLLLRRCTLAIPPSAAAGNHMIFSDLWKTSEIANVRTYVEQPIRKMKVCNLKIRLP